MGFMDGKFATNALLSVKGAVTAKSYNDGGPRPEEQKTDMLCKPWYVGNARRTTSRTTRTSPSTTRTATSSLKEKCFDIAPVDQSTRPDARLGEEVQAQHGLEAKETTT